MLVLVAGCMVVFLGMAALAIDLGSFRQARQQAQSTADAAALAASYDLPSNPTPTQIATATSDAKAYVISNMPAVAHTYTCASGQPGVCITTPYNGISNEIRVAVTQNLPSSFGGVLGVTSATVSASAVAKQTATTSCSTPGTGCDAVFAKDSSCSDNSVIFGGGTHITGGINSNGSLNVGGGGSSFGPTTYGSGCTVSPSKYQQQNNTFTSGPTAQALTATWPIDYATDFPPCTGAACTGPGGTPSFCTSAFTAASTTLDTYTKPYTLTSGQIYCEVGSGTASDPTTWNGALTVNGGPAESTFVAGSVTLGGGDNLTWCGYSSSSPGYNVSACNAAVPQPATGSYPLIYAVGSGTSINNAGGGGTFVGDMFAPNGTIYIGGGVSTTFLEALDVSIPGGGFTGDGPSDSGTSSSSGSASLVG